MEGIDNTITIEVWGEGNWSTYSAEEEMVRWVANKGKTTQSTGEDISPKVGLIHELGHAVIDMITKHLKLRDKFMEMFGFSEEQMLSLIEEGKNYKNYAHEESNMDFSERPVAEDLGEGVRKKYLDYEGSPVKYYPESMKYY